MNEERAGRLGIPRGAMVAGSAGVALLGLLLTVTLGSAGGEHSTPLTEPRASSASKATGPLTEPAPPTDSGAQFDARNGIFLITPPGWYFLKGPSGPLAPPTIFALANYPIREGGECAPTTALGDLPPDGALAWVIEYGSPLGNDFPPRPARFSLDRSTLALYECSGIRPTYLFRFTDQGRYFQVQVAFGERAGESRRNQMLSTLSSLVVDRCPPALPFVSVSAFGTLAPREGMPGDSVTLSGPTGRDENWFWAPLTKIEVWWSTSRVSFPRPSSNQLLLETIEPGTECSFTATFKVPSATPGRYVITVLGYFHGDGFGPFAVRSFTVTG